MPDDKNVPVLVQVCGKPVLRYIAVAFLPCFFRPLLASNCIHAAERTAAKKKSDYTLYEMVAIIASQGHGYPLVYPEFSNSDGIVYAVG